MNACVVHPSGIMGPNDRAISETTGSIIKIMNGELPVGMAGSFNLCDVRDLAYGTIAACDKGRKGECYILGNKEITFKEMAKMLHKACGCKQPLFYVPMAMAYRLADSMEKKAAKKGEKPIMTRFAVYNLDRNNNFDYSKAERELGYHTRPYEETLTDEARWLVEAGLVKGSVKVTGMAAAAPAAAVPAAVPAAAPAAEVSLQEKIASAVADRNFVQLVADTASADELQALLQEAHITGFDRETLEEAYGHIVLSRDSLAMVDLIRDRCYYSCKKKLSDLGVETTPAEYDLIGDIFGAAHDDGMAEDMAEAQSIETAAEVLEVHGHYHISEDFLRTMLEYCTLLDEEGIFTEQDYAEMDECTFEERCVKYTNKLQAMGVIAGLRYGIHDSFEIPYLIAMAGCAAMIRQRKAQA